MKCKDIGSFQQNRLKRQVLGVCSFPVLQHWAGQTQYRREKKKAGKAMYKISKINTIFIIDMLQNKVP